MYLTVFILLFFFLFAADELLPVVLFHQQSHLFREHQEQMVARDSSLWRHCACGSGRNETRFAHTKFREICNHTGGTTIAQRDTCPQSCRMFGKEEDQFTAGVRGGSASGGEETKIEASLVQNTVIKSYA